jgi:hypothetical protein
MSCKSKSFGEETEGDPAYQNAGSHNLNFYILDFTIPALSCLPQRSFWLLQIMAAGPCLTPSSPLRPKKAYNIGNLDAVDLTTEGYFEERRLD